MSKESGSSGGAQAVAAQPKLPADGASAASVGASASMGSCSLPDYPVEMVCHHCKASIRTTTVREIGLTNWMAAGAVALVGAGFLCIYTGCCLVPFCIGPLKDVNHYCPECSKVLGQYKILA